MDLSYCRIYKSGAWGVSRVYRGGMAASKDPGLYMVAKGGAAMVIDLHAYDMGTIWERKADQPARTYEPATT